MKGRTAAIPIRDDQVVRLITQRVGDSRYELWVIAEERHLAGLVDHYFTSNDLESRLSYALPGDLVWSDARAEAIPPQKLGHGFIVGENVTSKTIDHEEMRYHLINALSALPVRRQAVAAARRTLVGSWTDGVVSMALRSDKTISFARPPLAGHPFGEVAGLSAPSWRLGNWQLGVFDTIQGSGIRVAVLRVDDAEFHVARTRTRDDAIAHVFRRVDAAEAAKA